MIIEIVGKPRAGKTALNTLFIYLEQKYKGRIMLERSMHLITQFNKQRDKGEKPLTLPTKAPIYSNYETSIKTGYKEVFEPYLLNPYKLGVPTPQTADKLQYMLPFSCLHVTEGRKYWDGRESSSMPDNVSQFFETHGHNYMTIIIDVQRGKALDLNIRENATKFIEVQYMRKDKDAYGRIIRCTWYCKEFYSLQDYEAYILGKAGYYCRDTKFVYEGNIFEFFNSRNRLTDYIPTGRNDYSVLEFVGADELKKLPVWVKEQYNMTRPDWVRKSAA